MPQPLRLRRHLLTPLFQRFQKGASNVRSATVGAVNSARKSVSDGASRVWNSKPVKSARGGASRVFNAIPAVRLYKHYRGSRKSKTMAKRQSEAKPASKQSIGSRVWNAMPAVRAYKYARNRLGRNRRN